MMNFFFGKSLNRFDGFAVMMITYGFASGELSFGAGTGLLVVCALISGALTSVVK